MLRWETLSELRWGSLKEGFSPRNDFYMEGFSTGGFLPRAPITLFTLLTLLYIRRVTHPVTDSPADRVESFYLQPDSGGLRQSGYLLERVQLLRARVFKPWRGI